MPLICPECRRPVTPVDDYWSCPQHGQVEPLDAAASDWEHYIEQGLEWVGGGQPPGRVVLLMTPHSVRRPDGYCLNEIARALGRDLPVIPVMVSDVEPPLSICRLQWLD